MTYWIEVQSNGLWVQICGYTEMNMAVTACSRAVLAYKTASRVIGDEFGELVYERFYNAADDPDENWRDEYREDFDIPWQEAGF